MLVLGERYGLLGTLNRQSNLDYFKRSEYSCVHKHEGKPHEGPRIHSIGEPHLWDVTTDQFDEYWDEKSVPCPLECYDKKKTGGEI